MAISYVIQVFFLSFRNEPKRLRDPLAFCWVVLISTPPPPLSIFFSDEVLSLFAMPKVDPRNKVGTTNRVLSNHTTKNIYSNVNYAKTFLQGTVIREGRIPSGS